MNLYQIQPPPESEPTTVVAPMRGSTTTPRGTSSATTPATVFVAGSTATANLPQLAVPPLPARGWNSTTSRWGERRGKVMNKKVFFLVLVKC